MSYFGDGLADAWQLISTGDPYIWGLVETTMKLAVVSTGIAAVIGLPLGVVIGAGRFRGRGVLRGLANAGVGLPPVLVGLVLALLFLPQSSLGRFHLIFTLEGVYVAQTVLAFPIVVALTSTAVQTVTPGLLDQARAFGAGRVQVAILAGREARVGIVAALVVAVFSAMSEVGAVVLVGGNIEGLDQTLASAALQSADAAHFARGIAIGIVLLVLIVVVGGLLSLLQRVDRQPFLRRRLR